MKKHQKTLRQGHHRANHVVGLKTAFSDIAKETSEDRSAVMNLTNTNSTLVAQVAEYKNHLTSKDSGIVVITKQITNLQDEVENLKARVQGDTGTGKNITINSNYKPHSTLWGAP